MILPMKKLSLVVMDKHREESLKKLRELGVVHIEDRDVSSSTISALLDRKADVEKALDVLTAYEHDAKVAAKAAAKTKKKGETTVAQPAYKRSSDFINHEGAPFSVDALNTPDRKRDDFIQYILKLEERYKFLSERKTILIWERSKDESWGEFNPEDLHFLEKNGLIFYLYEIAHEDFAALPSDIPYFITGKNDRATCIVTVGVEIPDKTPFAVGENSISEINSLLADIEVQLKDTKTQLVSLVSRKQVVKKELETVLQQIEFETANSEMETLNGAPPEYTVSWISGFVPAEDMGRVKAAAVESSWAFIADDPKEEDSPPTKLKNGSFVKLIYPVTSFLELIPGYRERDISFWFLIFFTLFFAMIFGDAAYGIILLAISFVCIAKTRKKGVPLFFKFLLLMSIANITWGTLVCSWFGLDTALVPQFLQNISLPLIVNTSELPGWLASYNMGNYWIQSGLVTRIDDLKALGRVVEVDMMLFCFTVALVQLSIAHIMNIISLIRSPKVLAEIGRLGILFGMYFVILSLIVYNNGFAGIESWQLYIMLGGFVLLFIFGNYEGSVIKSVLASCSNFITVALNLTNVFSDIMSYIRLWAVGLASASIAGIINDFASPMLSHFAYFAFGLFLFGFGHCFNMVLNVLSILVHGVRLNMLEFSSHVGLSWSGYAYKPFAKR